MNRFSMRFVPAIPPWECELCCVTMRSWPSTSLTVTERSMTTAWTPVLTACRSRAYCGLATIVAKPQCWRRLPADDCYRRAEHGAVRGPDPSSGGTDGRAARVRVPRAGAFVGRVVRYLVCGALRARPGQPGGLARALHHRRVRGGAGGRPAGRG